MPQNGEGIRVTGTAVPGGTITLNLGPNDSHVEVSVGGSSKTSKYFVPGNKNTPIPIPVVPPGTSVVIAVGKGNRKRRVILIVTGQTP